MKQLELCIRMQYHPIAGLPDILLQHAKQKAYQIFRLEAKKIKDGAGNEKK